MPGLSVEGVSKSYGTLEAVKDVTFAVDDGEFVVLLGPSGSGKTTLLRCIAGLEALTSGKVFIGGKDVTSVPTRERDVSMVFQSYALFPLMSARANIAFPLSVRKIPKDKSDRRVLEISEKLGIGRLLDKFPRQLSGGEQQRVAIARALVRKTNAVLMDEPFSNLDAPLRSQLRVELKSLQRDLKTTILYVTHDQVEAMTLSDRVGVMNRGRMEQFDESKVLYEKPTSAFVAGFVGNPAASVLRLATAKNGSRILLKGRSIELVLPSGTAARLSRLNGEEVLAAFRAESIALSRSGTQGAVEGKVGLVEPLGASNMVVLTTGDGPLRGLVPQSFAPKIGETLWASIDATSVAIFDAKTEQPIS